MEGDTTENSLAFLAGVQESDGSFPSFTSPDRNDFTDATMCQSVFSTALILSCLSTVDRGNETLKAIKRNAVDFLRAQKSEHGSFNYWARGSAQAHEMPYPDDLDDTFCALAALHEYDPDVIDGEVLAKAVSLLTMLEVAEGGPYRTWLVSPDADEVWRDVDLAVNSNIAYFLSLQEVTLDRLIAFVENAIDTENYSSPYYPSVYPVIYFISRWYRGEKRDKLVAFLLARREEDAWGNPLDTALAVLALVNLGLASRDLVGSLAYLTRMRHTDGSWNATPFYTGINPDQREGDTRMHYAGSPALTTAFCLAAIARFAADTNVAQAPVPRTEVDELYDTVVARAQKTFSTLGPELRGQAYTILDQTVMTDRDRQIVLLPYFFLRALGRSLTPDLEPLVRDLGLANLYGWMAYTIYDDFLDEEGDPAMLSVANVALREADRIFYRAVPGSGFAGLTRRVLDRIDSANAWEVAHCRVKEKTITAALHHSTPDFSDVGRLSDRSLGHTLGPLGVLCALGYEADSPECTSILEGLRHYIAAKQLHDDMHDWEEDLARGHINAASATLLETVDRNSLPQEVDTVFLQRTFWEEVAVPLCGRAHQYLDEAENLLRSAGVTRDFVDSLLDPLRTATEKTMKERGDAEHFIAAYTRGNV